MKISYLMIALLLLVQACSFLPRKKPALEEDFIETVDAERRETVRTDINELKTRISEDRGNADLHRNLAVCYRLMGTPRSRLLSLESIERAIELDPKNPLNYVEKGLTLYARQFVGEAKSAFERAVRIDADCFEGWFQLGRLEQEEYLKTMCFSDHLRSSIDYYMKAYRLRKDDEQVLFRLGLLHFFRSMFVTGRKYAEKAVIRNPQNPRNHLLLGTALLYGKRFEECRDAYERAFSLMSDEEKRPYFSIAVLLPPDLRQLWKESMPDKKLEWNRKFWIEQDPTPSTEINERRLEHIKRVFLAQTLLTNKRIDLNGEESHRGLALISYGLPFKKMYDLGGGMSGGWVVWQYKIGDQYLNLYFHDEFLNGNYHFPISGSYGTMSLAMMDRVPQMYEYPIEYDPLPILVESAQTRGAGERTRLEFSIAVSDTIVDKVADSLNVILTFFDFEWNRIAREIRTIEPDTLPRYRKLEESFAVYNFWIELLPREMGTTCIVEAVDEASKLKGDKRLFFPIRDLGGRSLKLSSIEFDLHESALECADALDPIPVYYPDDLLCLSYEIYNLKRFDGNSARYRITYRIMPPDESEEAQKQGIRKTLSFIWNSISGGKDEDQPYITSMFEQSTSEDESSDRLQINISALEPGRYRLILHVEDLSSGEIALEERSFIVSDRSGY